MARRRRKALPPEPIELQTQSLSHDGRGVASNAEGKTVFVSGALAGDAVTARLTQSRQGQDGAAAAEGPPRPLRPGR